MKTKIIIFLILIAVLFGGVLLWRQQKDAKAPASVKETSSSIPVPFLDYKNTTYNINGSSVKLKNGYAETEITPVSAAKLITRYFGNEATADLTGDTEPEKAFLITQSGEGSGTFYYLVAALRTSSGYAGTNAVLLGDRIAPQTTEIKDREIIVNYADRKPNEPMTAQPSVGVSRYFRVENGTLVEISK